LTSADRTGAGVPRLRNVSFDVSAVVDSAHVAGSLFTPPGGSGAAGRTAVLVCLPGGSYTRAYWHLATTHV
jgi:hypothetical protein